MHMLPNASVDYNAQEISWRYICRIRWEEVVVEVILAGPYINQVEVDELSFVRIQIKPICRDYVNNLQKLFYTIFVRIYLFIFMAYKDGSVISILNNVSILMISEDR